MAVAYDLAGAGNNALVGFNPNVSITNTHTCSGTNRAVVIPIAGINNGFAATGQTFSATYDSVAMSLLGMVPDASGSASYVALFGLLNPSAVAGRTWVVDVSGGGNTGRALIGYPISYTGVASFGTVYTNFGPGTAMSVAASSASGRVVVGAFEAQSAISAFNQTSRGAGQVVGHATRIEGGDAAGSGSVNFTATAATGPFAGIAVDLVAAGGAPTSSFLAMF